MKTTREDGRLVIFIEGRIDSNNAAEFEQALTEEVSRNQEEELVLDAEALEYISSAGLRVLLRLRKSLGKDIVVSNVAPAVYDIFDVTGFTAVFKLEKAMRFVSVKGLTQLGAGVHSTVYRLDGETILKVVKDMTLDAIRAEVQVSKDALIHGIPTAISYDVVRTEEGYGEIYEMFRAGVLSAAVMAEPEKRAEYLSRFAAMYREIHGIEIADGSLESVRKHYLAAADSIAPYMTEEENGLLRKLILAIPERTTFVHGDYHMNNVMLQDGEMLLIDVGEAGYGHPLFDFAQTAYAYDAATILYPDRLRQITGMTMEEACYVRDNLFREYFGETGPALERKMTVVHGMSLLRKLLIFFLQGWGPSPEAVAKRVDDARKELFPRIDELCGLIESEFS